MATKKDKRLIAKIINKPYFIQALCHEYDNDLEREFIKNYGANFKEAEEALKSVISELEK